MATVDNDRTIVRGGGAGASTGVAGEGSILAGRYRLLKRLGAGGQGSVFLAEDLQLDGKRYAIKMVPAVLAASGGAIQSLKKETLTAQKLVHPNIVQIRAFEENGGEPFIVMDYVEGLSLADAIVARGGCLGEGEIRNWLGQVAAALDYAHGEGVVHRDIKPSNIMLRPGDGRAFVLDFGIARELVDSMTRVTGQAVSGTLLYMSPEQLRGETPTPAQDVYSFAATVYECVAGKPPFTSGAIAHQIENVPPRPLPRGCAFGGAVLRGLAKTASGRPSSCAEVLVADGAPAAFGGFGFTGAGLRKGVSIAKTAVVAAAKAYFTSKFTASLAASRAAIEAVQKEVAAPTETPQPQVQPHSPPPLSPPLRPKTFERPAAQPAESSGAAGCDVILVETGWNKIAVIKELRDITGAGLKDAKDMAEGTPIAIAQGVSRDEARRFAAQLERAGAKVRIQ